MFWIDFSSHILTWSRYSIVSIFNWPKNFEDMKLSMIVSTKIYKFNITLRLCFGKWKRKFANETTDVCVHVYSILEHWRLYFLLFGLHSPHAKVEIRLKINYKYQFFCYFHSGIWTSIHRRQRPVHRECVYTNSSEDGCRHPKRQISMSWHCFT